MKFTQHPSTALRVTVSRSIVEDKYYYKNINLKFFT